MRLQGGVRLGRYEILEHIGAGGMGDVYRARDLTLDRMVAIKTVAAGFARDPSALPRFELERRIGAHLEHPHICRLLDAGREGGVDYLAMEFLEGESLATQLRRGALSTRDALGHAIEIADALEYAHRQGVVHRDVKPANVFLTPNGVKVLDFGLATLRSGAPSRLAQEAQTVPLAVPADGSLLGSAPYMAPERLRGGDADARTDVFGFGLVLYEMLTGRRAFDGSSPAAITAAILNSDPPSLNLRTSQGEDLEWIVSKCLEKRPEERWQAIGDVSVLLKRIAGRHRSRRRYAPATSPMQFAAAVGVLAAVVAAGFFALGNRRVNGRPAEPVALTIAPPAGGVFTLTEGSVQTPQLAVAPDGRSVVFVASGPATPSQLWIRAIDSVAPRPVQGTSGASYPFWSPDGRSIAYFAGGDLLRIDLAGGPARVIASAPNGRGGTWSSDDVILFAPNTTGGILRVSASGSAAQPATVLDTTLAHTSHRWPHFLPDGRRFFFFARSSQQAEQGIYLGSLDTPGATRVVSSNFGGVYLNPDRVLFLAEGTLLVRQLDLSSGRAVGEPVLVAEQVGGSSNFYGAFSASATGVIAYADNDLTSDIGWVARQGSRGEVIARSSRVVDFQLSPDGQRLALADVVPESGLSDLFVVDLLRGTRVRLTAGRATDASPLWSPDGNTVLYRSNVNGVHDLFLKRISAAGLEKEFYRSAGAKYPTSWSKDGESVLLHTRHDQSAWDVWIARIARGGYTLADARPLLQSSANEVQAKFSPDGGWVAYTSDESGREEVYVLSLSTDDRMPVSVGGGSDPHWRDDGKELFYVSPNGDLNSIAIERSANRLDPGIPRRLFRVGSGIPAPPYLSAYDVAPGGTRFLVREVNQDPRLLPLTVRLNWQPGQQP